MATTGELLTIIEELELVDIGDAASYLGEEVTNSNECLDTTALLLSAGMGCLIHDDFACAVR